MALKNFLIDQYKNNSKLKINHSYLVEQFHDYKKIFKKIEKIVKFGDYTLGSEVDNFEKNLAKRTGSKFAIGVGNGTDALFLALKVFNIGNGDEVITTPYTFIATTASIVTSGAKPVFVDIKRDYNIDENKIEKAITKKTKAIMIVHWSGRPCELDKIKKICKKYKLKLIQDSCHAIDAKFKGKNIVSFGDICTFSMHPLKNLNIWGDGGFMLTQNKDVAKKIQLLRNHGLINRDRCEVFGFNSRLDTLQAAVANYKLKNKLNKITNMRIKNAKLFDKLLKKNPKITTVKREKYLKEVFHLYQINLKERDKLAKHLNEYGIDAKVHYPTPVYLQPAAKFLKHKKGDFPVADNMAKTSLSLPVHEFVKKSDIYKVSKLINNFLK